MSNQSHHKSYDPDFFASLFEVEDNHFWFRTRNKIIGVIVEQLVSGWSPNYYVLEVGCGTGNVLRVLKDAASSGIVIGMDLFAEGLAFAARRTSVPLVQGDMQYPPFSNRFNLIGLFDVLEHLPDDGQVLKDIRGILSEDGVLVLTVPAHPRLWSYFDEASHHCRRYQPDELTQKLTDAGFQVEHMTQYMMSIYPLVLVGRYMATLRRRLTKQKPSNEELANHELRLIPIINSVLSILLGIEGRWLAKGRVLPLGTSLLAIARKSSNCI